MAPRLPERFRLEVRLGTDGDIEEWLATDLPLDRPVLLRFLPSGTSPDRSDEFLETVRAAAGVSHTHVATIYAAGTIDDTTYSISEWAGGVSLADRALAREAIPPEELLPNAAGLSSALAAIHAAGIVHGAIDAEAILFSAAHPAKIAGFGRPPRWRTATEDVQSLSALFETTITGRPIGAASPSQVVDAISPEVDRALEQGRSGEVDALQLAGALRAAPLLTPPRRRWTGWNWRWVGPASVLFVVAGLLVLLGSNLAGQGGTSLPPGLPDSGSPATTRPSDAAVTGTTGTTTPEASLLVAQVVSATAYDPFGTDGEHDELASRAIDGDFTTSWTTESYNSPLPRLKEGVGLSVSVRGPVTTVEISGARDGTVFELYWAPGPVSAFGDWTRIAEGTIRNGGANVSVPPTDGGVWLVWYTDLPATTEGTYTGAISEVRFGS